MNSTDSSRPRLMSKSVSLTVDSSNSVSPNLACPKCPPNLVSHSSSSSTPCTHNSNSRLHSLVRSLQNTVAPRVPNSLASSASTPCVLATTSSSASSKSQFPQSKVEQSSSNSGESRCNCHARRSVKNPSSESLFWSGKRSRNKRTNQPSRQLLHRSQSSECTTGSSVCASNTFWRTSDSLVPLCTANTASLIFAFYNDEEPWSPGSEPSSSTSSSTGIKARSNEGTTGRLVRPLDLLSKMTASANDSKYKNYVASIDKALKSFEYTSEWADLVSALSKLNRVLTSNARYKVIPRRFIVGQRLAQCMHPLLPSGVHLKALETYDLIFGCLGPQRLLSELTIYSNGLFPLLANAAINVRPALLELYENHLVPLGPALGPALDGFLIGVLPCYEEGSDSFTRTEKLLKKIAHGIGGQAYFFDSLWRVILYNSSVRLPAINFVMGQYNKKRSLSEQSHILGLCMQTLVKAICASLLDSKILVQRAILDLLLLIFPLHANLSNEMQQAMAASPGIPFDENGKIQPPNSLALPSLGGNTDSAYQSSIVAPTRMSVPRKHLKRSELVAIITAALTVLLRRDVSLNRRLQSWFFGADSSSASASASGSSKSSSSNATKSAFHKSSNLNELNQSSKDKSSAETKPTRKSKRIVYFENYAKSFVIEAFKRCITDPVSAITSVLPASSTTNSFISFTLQTDYPESETSSSSTDIQSGLMSATSTANHNQRTRQVINSSFSNPSEHTSTTNSTFWPYRLLICILDQRDLATPILETLCVDILRGLYHEFELLTNIVPPPSEPSKDSPDVPNCADPDCSLTSFSEGEEDDDENEPESLKSEENIDHNIGDQTYSTHSITDCDDASDTLSDKARKIKKYRPRSSGTPSRTGRPAYLRSNSGSSRKTPRRLPGVRRLSSSSSASKRTAIFASAPTVADVENGSESSPDAQKGDVVDFHSSKAVPGFAVPAKQHDLKIIDKQDSSESSEIESDSKKIKENLFTNLRRNVKTKSVHMMRKFRPSSNKQIPNNSSSGSKMKTVMQTLPLVKQLKTKLSKYEERSTAKKKAKKLGESMNHSANAAINSHPTDDVSNVASQMPSVTIIEDEKFFSLRHQHYYWNPYYQQLSKSQRKELLKELDRVMHLLITGIGNDFIWNKLETIFDTATSEAISLRKLLRMIIKDVEQYEKRMFRHDSEDLSQDSDDDTDAYSDTTDENSENVEESLDCSLTWARRLAASLLNEFMHENRHRTVEKKDESAFFVGEDSLRFDLITGKAHSAKQRPKISSTSTTWLKHKILNGLSDRCRECHQPLPYRSPVQPVGTDSITILEVCTLVRFLLGDSHPYHQQESIFLGDDETLLNGERSSMLTNSVSSSMNRSSALEPLAVGTANYHFMIRFLERVLQLMSENAKSFSPVDLAASVELCLALCAKLKPAIMQTFVKRYRSALSEHLNTVRAKSSGNSDDNQTHHRRKSSSGSWFSQIGGAPPIGGSKKARTSSTASSKKHLEQVKEEQEDEEALSQKPKIDAGSETFEDGEDCTDTDPEMTAINEDMKFQTVVDGVLNFFTIFVESILLKSDNRAIAMAEYDPDCSNQRDAELPANANRMLEFFRDTICNSRANATDEYMVRDRLAFRHQLLPVYERLCELLIEIGTTPVLTSPAIFIKKRQQSKKSVVEADNVMYDDTFANLGDVFHAKDGHSRWVSVNARQSNSRWFMYLMVLASDRLTSCANKHAKNFDLPNAVVCCQLRQIAMTSLTTALDLMTISRAYLLRKLPDENRFGETVTFQPSSMTESEASDWDLFPGTFKARRLNFFPLIPVDMLQHLYADTAWFSMVSTRLWSNLSPADSSIHYSTIALLQQLHSVASDSSVCESVLCDEMTGGELSRKWLEYDTDSLESFDFDDDDATFNSYNAFTSYDAYRGTILNHNDWSNKFNRTFNNDKIYTARTKFQLLFETIRDIRFVSERLALIVTGLASAAKIDSELEPDEHVDQFDSSSTITANTVAVQSNLSSTSVGGNPSAAPASSSTSIVQALRQAIRSLFDTPGDLLSSELISAIDPTSTVELDRLLRLTSPISPVALGTTLKRHFDRPLFIMLDALARRRNFAEHQSAAADWLLRCLSPFDPFGARSLPLPTSPLLISYYLATGDPTSNSDGSSDRTGSDYLFGGFGANTDIGRLLEPLLFILLHPNTNRLSVQNVSIERFAKRKNAEMACGQVDQSFGSFEIHDDVKHSSPLKYNEDITGDAAQDDSKIYQISSTSGNVIYHVRKSSPPRADSIHSSPSVSVRDGHSPSFLSNRFSSMSHRFDTSLNQSANKFTRSVNFASPTLDSMKSEKQIISEMIDDMVDRVAKSLNSPALEGDALKSHGEYSSFPGMAKSGRFSAGEKNATDDERSSSRLDYNDPHESGTQIHISHLHMHLLLYERQFDSARTIYAFDTLLNMIETWPERMLYSMATTTFGDVSQLIGASGGHLDGTRVAQIQDLYIRHRNSIRGRGFQPDTSNENSTSASNDRTSGQDPVRSSSMRSSSFNRNVHKKKSKDSSKESSTAADSNSSNQAKSILHNVSLLELNVQICLWYLRSYYSSCSNDGAEFNRDSQPVNTSQRLKDLFANLDLKNGSNGFQPQQHQPQQPHENAENLAANLIDLESVLGNQRVRLMACQLLSIIFQHLSTMMGAFKTGASFSAATSSAGSRFFWKKHDSIPNWALNVNAFAQYLHDMLLRCEVQRNVLQCLVTSVWHFNARKNSSDPEKGAASEMGEKNSSSSLYPKNTDPAAEVFVSEILNFNDYSSSKTKTGSGSATGGELSDEDCGFHEEFEKSLLRLLEQVMFLENRVSTTTGVAAPTSIFYTNENEHRSSSGPVFKLQRFSTDLTELRFDPNVSLAAQPLLHGAIQAALQQDPRRHLAWLSLVESSIAFAGRSLSRLVLCVLSQLCCNLDTVVKQIDTVSTPDSPKTSTPAFTSKHILTTLQSITMLLSRCLMDRSQLETLLPYLAEIFDEHDSEQLKNYGLGSALNTNRGGRRNRMKEDSNQDMAGSGGGASPNSLASNGPIQNILVIFQNFVLNPIGSTTVGPNPTSTTGTGTSTVGGSEDSQSTSNASSDTPALLDARKSILSILNRVIVALFNVWCNLVVVGEDEEELRSRTDQWEPNTFNRSLADDSMRKLSMCCHYYTKTQSGLPGNYSSAESVRKRERYRQSCCASGWSSASHTGWYIMGSAARIRKSITVLLSILAASHGPNLMSSIAQVWAELRDSSGDSSASTASHFNYLHASVDLVIAPVSSAQRRLIRLIGSLSPIFPLELLVQTIRTSMKNASSGLNNRKIDKNNFYVMEVSILEFLLAYIRSVSGPVLLESWRSIFNLVRDAMTLNVQVSLPTEMLASLAGSSVSQQWSATSNTAAVTVNIQPLVNFHLLAILHEFLFIAPLSEDRKAGKEMQDIATRLIEAIIISSTVRLSHSRWSFRRNLEVSVLGEENERKTTKKGDHSPSNSVSDTSLPHDDSSIFSNFFTSGANFSLSGSTTNTGSTVTECAQAMFDSFFCVKALYALSEFAALVLDVVYPSDEKEKMNPLISNLMSYVVPYLRAHVAHNWACFDACTRLLATLTDYQHTRKAWRKDTLDLLVDGAFFQMPAECLSGWRTIVDRVMTHDKNTFRDFLSRIALQNSSSSALNKIFTPAATVRDQEAESKAQLVKRLAFILFCSEKDQYQKYMSEIQEKLIEIHRTSQSPLVQAQVLLAFRVIILRMSPQHLASLWPFIYTEMFQVFLNIEQQLLEYIRTKDQRFLNGSPGTDYMMMLAGGTGVGASQSANSTPIPTPTLWETREFYGSPSDVVQDRQSNCDSTRTPTTPLKFKPIPPPPPPNSGKNLFKSPPTPTSSSAFKEEKFCPKIAPQHLQLLLNACKLLDLALILPSDTLPIFQLHRWTFVGDGTGYQYPNHIFDLGTLFSASANSASNGVVDFANATPTPSVRHQMLNDNDSDGGTLQSSHSTGNFMTGSDTGPDSIGTADSLSMNSALSSLNESGPSSLSTVSITSRTTLTPQSSAHQSQFIPHIVFLNSILNYLSYVPTKPMSYSNSAPILVSNQIESVHDLHAFFAALLSRSNRTPTVYTPYDGQDSTDNQHRFFKGQTDGVGPKSSRKPANGTGNGRKSNGNKQQQQPPMSSKFNIPRHDSSTAHSNASSSAMPSASSGAVESVSLEELFFNIDRIIANDFLEPLSNTTEQN